MPGQALLAYLKPTWGGVWIHHLCVSVYVPKAAWS
jgi:hypothetical protein